MSGEVRCHMARLQRLIWGATAPLVATAIWLPTLRFFFTPSDAYCVSTNGVPPRARELAARHLRMWTEPALKAHELDRMRRSNAEWDFMGRSFLVWSLGG